MSILVAIDSWKGCLASREVNEVVRNALLSVRPDAKVLCATVSDGGEGFLEAVEATGKWNRMSVEVLDPLLRPIQTQYLFCKDNAVIEMAQASGLALLREEERNPLVASSYGTGQLIAHAVRCGAHNIVVGLGGSATSDCGKGMLKALEEAFGTLDALRNVHFTVATDVTNPLTGALGAAHVFARQKGATPQMVEELESRAQCFARESALLLGHDLSEEPGAGAAGGLGYALMQYLNAQRVSGVDFVLDKALPHTTLQNVSLIITGEGHADRQTLMGKLPVGILRRAQSHDIPVVLIAGQVSDRDALLSAGFAQVLSVTPPDMPLSKALRPDVARRNITTCISKANFTG